MMQFAERQASCRGLAHLFASVTQCFWDETRFFQGSISRLFFAKTPAFRLKSPLGETCPGISELPCPSSILSWCNSTNFRTGYIF